MLVNMERVRNERGRDLEEFTEICNLKIANIFAKQKMKRKWTWISPNFKVRNEMDHILVNDLSVIKNVATLSRFGYPSDHRISRGEIVILKRSRYKNFKKQREEGKWIIPVKSNKKNERRIRRKSTRSGRRARRVQNYTIREVTETLEKYGIRRKEEKTGDKLKQETIDLINKKNQRQKRKMKKRNDKIELAERNNIHYN